MVVFEVDSFALQLPTAEAGAYPLVFPSISEPIGVTGAICDHPVGSKQTARQDRSAGEVTNLTYENEEH